MNETVPVISSKLPDLINSYIQLREKRLAEETVAEAMKAEEEVLKKTIISKMREEGITSQGGIYGTVKMGHLVEPVAENWEQVWSYVRENNAFHLLHKRLTNTAVKELWDAGQTVPGVGKQDVYKLTVSKGG